MNKKTSIKILNKKGIETDRLMWNLLKFAIGIALLIVTMILIKNL